MKLTFYGGARMVTGANYLLETNGHKILIDCGLQQGSRYCERCNFDPFPYDPSEIEAVFVTHTHLDHIGRLPKLVKQGFKGKVYSTEPTRAFSQFLLEDSERILGREAKREKLPPIYNKKDVDVLMKSWEVIPYHKEIALGVFTIKFYNAGHILGSSFIEIQAEGKTIIFSGDLGNSPAPLIKSLESIEKVDYCLIESTYGGRIHKTAIEAKGILEDVIEDTVKAGGTLMIPAFAMERTQDLLVHINQLIEHKRIPQIPIFLDSPLAIKLSGAYQKFRKYLNEETNQFLKEGNTLFDFPALKKTLTTEESKAINNVAPPKVIIAGSGMSQGGRILHHERRYLSDPKSMILFIGYQAKGSLGRKIFEGAKRVKLFRENIPVRCRVKAIGGYSAHADQRQLLNWLKPMRHNLKKVFIVQGEEDQALALAQKVQDELAVKTKIPFPNDDVIL